MPVSVGRGDQAHGTTQVREGGREGGRAWEKGLCLLFSHCEDSGGYVGPVV